MHKYKYGEEKIGIMSIISYNQQQNGEQSSLRKKNILKRYNTRNNTRNNTIRIIKECIYSVENGFSEL